MDTEITYYAANGHRMIKTMTGGGFTLLLIQMNANVRHRELTYLTGE